MKSFKVQLVILVITLVAGVTLMLSFGPTKNYDAKKSSRTIVINEMIDKVK